MKQYVIEKLNLDRLEIVKNEEPVGGSRPRLVLRHKRSGRRFLLKTYNHNSREIWAELMASKLSELIDLDVQQVSIKSFEKDLFPELVNNKDWLPVGVLVKNAFKRQFDIYYGQNIVGTGSPNLNLELIERSIRERYYAPEDLLESFAKMIIFDAFIGNMDRHHENWGVIELVDLRQLTIDPKSTIKERHFATLFDHGSSLLFELDDNNVTYYLSNKDRFENEYTFGKKYTYLTLNENPVNIFVLIEWYIRNDSEKWGKRFKKAIKYYSKIHPLDLAKTLLKMPVCDYIDYNEDRKRLLYNSLLIRKNKLESFI